MKKLLTAGIITLSISGGAVAQEIFLDIGADYSNPDIHKAAGDTTTGWKDEMLLDYYSQSYVDDVDNSGDLSFGDKILSAGGLIGGPNGTLALNSVGGFTPGEGFPANGSNNDYGDSWLISFRFDDLMGTFNGTDFIYSSGTIDWLIFDSSTGAAEHHLFSTDIQNHTSIPGNQVFSGEVYNFGADVINGVDVGDIFNIKWGGSSISFEDYTTTYDPFKIDFRIDQNTDDPIIVGNTDVGYEDYEFKVESAKHNASLAFHIPEPTSIALFGLALVGLAGAARRKV